MARRKNQSEHSKHLGLLDKLKWRREQNGFQHGLRRLRQMKEKVDLEIGAANNEQIKKQYEEIIDAHTQPTIQAPSLKLKSLEYPPNIFSVPYPRNGRFYGRQSILADIHNRLHSAKLTIEAIDFVVLCGLGGSGKTQIALEYVYKYSDSYDACIWISCDTRTKTAQSSTDVARKLEVANAQQQHLIALVKD